jgi:hypothetical protein
MKSLIDCVAGLKDALSAAAKRDEASAKREEAAAQREAVAALNEDRLRIVIKELTDTVADLRKYLAEEHNKNSDLVQEVCCCACPFNTNRLLCRCMIKSMA